MPTYEYKCKLCDERLEIEQSITDDALTSLPGCAEDADGDHLLKKVFSAVGISFKGDGFYRNDSRSKSTSSTSSSSSTSDSDSPSSSDSSDSSSSSDSPSSTSTTSTDSSSGSSDPKAPAVSVSSD